MFVYYGAHNLFNSFGFSSLSNIFCSSKDYTTYDALCISFSSPFSSFSNDFSTSFFIFVNCKGNDFIFFFKACLEKQSIVEIREVILLPSYPIFTVVPTFCTSMYLIRNIPLLCKQTGKNKGEIVPTN